MRHPLKPFQMGFQEDMRILKVGRGMDSRLDLLRMRLPWTPWEEKERDKLLIPHLEKALEESPDDWLYWWKLANCYVSDGRRAEAVRAAEKAYEIRPSDPRSPFTVARAYRVLTDATLDAEEQMRRKGWTFRLAKETRDLYEPGVDPEASQRALDELGLTVEEAGAKARALFEETLTHELSELWPLLQDERNTVEINLMEVRRQFDSCVDGVAACRALGKHVDSWLAVIPGMAEKVKNVEYDALGAFLQGVRREIPGVSTKLERLALALAQPARSFSLVQKKLGLGATLTMAVRIARIGDYLYVEWHLFERGRLTARIEYYVGIGLVGAGVLTLFLARGGPILIGGAGLIPIAIGGAIIWHAQRTPKLAPSGTRRDESRAFRDIVHSSLRDALINVGIAEDAIKVDQPF